MGGGLGVIPSDPSDGSGASFGRGRDPEHERWLQEFLARNRDAMERQRWVRDFVARNQGMDSSRSVVPEDELAGPEYRHARSPLARTIEQLGLTDEAIRQSALGRLGLNPDAGSRPLIAGATMPQGRVEIGPMTVRPASRQTMEPPRALSRQLAQARALVPVTVRPATPNVSVGPVTVRPSRPSRDDADAAARLLRIFTARM